MIVHASINIRQHIIRIIIAMAPINYFKLWSQNVSQAYIQRRGNFTRDGCTRHKHDFNLKSDDSLKVVKRVYMYSPTLEITGIQLGKK